MENGHVKRLMPKYMYLVNMLINLWVWMVLNFQVIIYNYFVPVSVIMVQLAGYSINYGTFKDL